MSGLTYAVVTPVRDDEENLRRLASSLIAQTQLPSEWIVVDDASNDGSSAFVEELAREHSFVRLVRVPRREEAARGGPIVRSFVAGVDALEAPIDVVIKVDADISVNPDYFARLVAAFEADPRLGIASGSAYEEHEGVWRQRHMTRASAWGACRAYRIACLSAVSPLEERMGWDSIDEFRANVRGWTTRTLLDLPFRHHRREGKREGARWRAWAAQGRVAHYLGYRRWYLVVRTLYRCATDPSAFGMLAGYAGAAVRQEPRCQDLQAVAYLQGQQALHRLPLRIAEALGKRVR